MKFEVKNRHTGDVQFVADIDCDEHASYSVKLGLAVKLAVKTGADLSGACLRGADLSEANLSRACLREADLSGACLREADLSEANLSRACLRGADLRRACLREADLSEANLSRANLSRACLREADLSEANLRRACLREADLSEADLSEANLSRACLCDAKNIPEISKAQTLITPEGDIIGWKKCLDGVIVKLMIPSSAKRHNATGRKCRAEYADVLEVIGAEVGISKHDGKTEYRVGHRVTCDEWSEYRFEECAGGIHFFITRIEAEAY